MTWSKGLQAGINPVAAAAWDMGRPLFPTELLGAPKHSFPYTYIITLVLVFAFTWSNFRIKKTFREKLLRVDRLCFLSVPFSHIKQKQNFSVYAEEFQDFKYLLPSLTSFSHAEKLFKGLITTGDYKTTDNRLCKTDRVQTLRNIILNIIFNL